MKLILENWRGYLAENEDKEIEAAGAQAFTHLIKKLQQIEVEQPESQEEIDEAVFIAAAGLALAAPQILEIVGEIINWANRKGAAMAVQGPIQSRGSHGGDRSRRLGGSDFGNKLLNISEKWHHLYVGVIEQILCDITRAGTESRHAEPGSIARDDLAMSGVFEAQDKQAGDCDMYDVANKIFHLIVAAFLFAAGVGAIKAFMAAYTSASGRRCSYGNVRSRHVRS